MANTIKLVGVIKFDPKDKTKNSPFNYSIIITA